MIRVEAMTEQDWPDVQSIFREGISTGNATFNDSLPATWHDWSVSKINTCSLVARGATDERVLGWAALSPVSTRPVYCGVAEVSIYVAITAFGLGVGTLLMRQLIERSERYGIWTLYASIFPENTASLRLHERQGFRLIGRRERIAKMTYGAWAGHWRDTLVYERRSSVVGID